MKFGLFDHVDQSDRPLARLFDERLEYVHAADELGYHCYHVSEHHATPLNMAPVPGVYLGAAADVRADIARQIEELGINFMILGFYFGTLPQANAMRSLTQFAKKIMPALGGE